MSYNKFSTDIETINIYIKSWNIIIDTKLTSNIDRTNFQKQKKNLWKTKQTSTNKLKTLETQIKTRPSNINKHINIKHRHSTYQRQRIWFLEDRIDIRLSLKSNKGRRIKKEKMKQKIPTKFY
jgi:hypothetical protein